MTVVISNQCLQHGWQASDGWDCYGILSINYFRIH